MAIIGAGVAGLGIGWKLADAGVDVTVFERAGAGSGASYAAAGMLAPTAEVDFDEHELLELGQASLRMYPEFVAQLQAASGIDLDYRSEGTLMVALDADDAEALDRVYQYHRALDLPVDKLDAHQARQLEPALAPTLRSALRIASDHQVDPRRLSRALAAALDEAGGQLVEDCHVRAVHCDDGVEAIETDAGGRVTCQTVVVAAGAWTSQLEGIPDQVMPHIRPVRGQMLAVDVGRPALCRHVIRAPDAYLVPKSDGRLIIGATSEEMGFDPQMTAGGVFELLRGAWETLPGIYEQHLIDMWTGFRPVSLDNRPILGPTSVDGLWLATGHGRNGILLAAVTAVSVAEAIIDSAVPDVLKGFRPARFAK